MKNKVLNFEKEELDEFIIPDYFSKEIHISDDIDEFSDFLQNYQMVNNDKLERISLELYGTTDYWDIILMLNDRDPLFQMSYDYDIVYDNSINFIEIYANGYNIDKIKNRFSYSHGDLPIADPLEGEEPTPGYILKDLFFAESETDNETYRNIKVPKPTRMGEFLRLLKTKGYV